MSFVKCPRCDLNYIKDTEEYCDVCKREMKGEEEREVPTDICIECGENDAVSDGLCMFCLREKYKLENLEQKADESIAESVDSISPDGSLFEEIDMRVDIPPKELEEIDHELGIDDENDDSIEVSLQELADKEDIDDEFSDEDEL